MMPNKVVITMHIIAYFLIMIFNILFAFYYNFNVNNKGLKITAIFGIVVYFICNLIFGLIVNTIVTKIAAATN